MPITFEWRRLLPAPRAAAPGEPVAVDVVLPPARTLVDAGAMAQLAGALAHLPAPVALEIAGDWQERRLQLRGPRAAREHVAAQLAAVYDQALVEPLAPLEGQGVCEVTRLSLRRAEFLPLKTWDEFEQQDPLRALLGAFESLQPGESLLAQLILLGGAPADWARPHLRQLKHLQQRGFGADPLAPPLASPLTTVAWFGALLCVLGLALVVMWAAAGGLSRWLIALPLGVAGTALAAWLAGLAPDAWAEALNADAEAKLREPALSCELRLFAWAQDAERARALLSRLASAYQTFGTTSGNQWVRGAARPAPAPDDLTPAAPLRLSVNELAALWHMPVGDSPERLRRQTFERRLPRPAEVSDPQGARLGLARKGGLCFPVALARAALERNVLLIGKTQQGKSTAMAHLARHWLADRERALVVVDPHGDLARLVVGLAPRERVADLIYLDLADETRAASLNLLDVSDGVRPFEAAEAFMDVGRALWRDYWGPRMAIPLQYGLRALATVNQRRPPDEQFTLLALWELLTCPAGLRERFLRDQVGEGDEPGLYGYFAREYGAESAWLREQVIAPVLSKVRAFERTPVTQRLVGQPRSTFNLFEALRRRAVIVVNTDAGQLGEDLSGFVGSLILNLVRRAIVRQSQAARAARVRVAVIADEFQTLTGVDFGALLGELQKNGGHFVLGTQSLAGLANAAPERDLAGPVLAGVTTKIVFSVNGADAYTLARQELDQERLRPESLMNLPPLCAYVKTLGPDGEPAPVFSLELDPLPEPDPAIVEAVRRAQSAYTVPGDEADRRVRAAQRQAQREFNEPAPTRTEAGPATGEVRGAREVVPAPALPPLPDPNRLPARLPDWLPPQPAPAATAEQLRQRLQEASGERPA
jgi:hypothetical protein